MFNFIKKFLNYKDEKTKTANTKNKTPQQNKHTKEKQFRIENQAIFNYEYRMI